MMGTRGPIPQSTAELNRRGSWRAGERTDEPAPDAKAPPMPAWLSKAAKACWKAIVPKMAEMGYVAEIDQTAIAMGCQSLADYQQACRLLDLDGYSPMLTKQKDTSRAQLWKFCREFGMTSAARAAMGIELHRAKQESDKRAKYTEGVVGKIGGTKQA